MILVVMKEDYYRNLFDKRSQALKVACERMVQSYKQLSANDRAIVAKCTCYCYQRHCICQSAVLLLVSLPPAWETLLVHSHVPDYCLCCYWFYGSYMSYGNMTAAMQTCL